MSESGGDGVNERAARERPIGRSGSGLRVLLLVAVVSSACTAVGDSAVPVDRRQAEEKPTAALPPEAPEPEAPAAASDVEAVDVGPTDVYPRPSMELVWAHLEADDFDAAAALLEALSDPERGVAPEEWLLGRALLLLAPANPEADSVEARELLEELVALDLPAPREATLRTLIALVDSRARWRRQAAELRRTLEAMRAIDLEEPPP